MSHFRVRFILRIRGIHSAGCGRSRAKRFGVAIEGDARRNVAGGGRKGGSIGTLPKFSPMSAGDAAGAPHIRLVQGMLMVSAMTDTVSGDYELLQKVNSVDDRGGRYEYSSESPDSAFGGQKAPVQRAHGRKFDHRDDLQHATRVVNYFSAVIPEEIPGTTRGRLSAFPASFGTKFPRCSVC